jgi:hypothetical protein
MYRLILGIVCGLAAATPVGAEPTATAIAGRWQGQSFELARAPASCAEDQCTLTLDIVGCGEGWCGILVGAGNVCGESALKLDAGKGERDGLIFKGTLQLARGTEPYVVEAWLEPAAEDHPASLQLTGDTGGEFRPFRRAFPFNAMLARASEAQCRAPPTVSLSVGAAPR